MLVTALDIDCRKRDTLDIIFCGDDHIGSSNHCHRTAERVLKTIHDTGAYFCHTGDSIEAIHKSDLKRFDFRNIDKKLCYGIDEIDHLLQLQTDKFISNYEPVKEQLIAMVDGNHPDSLRRMYGIDPYYEIERKLKPSWKRRYGTHFLGYDGIILLYLKLTKTTVRRVDIYLHHGWSAPKSDGALVNELNNSFTKYDVDVIAVGHAHKAVEVRPQIITVKGTDIVHRHRFGIGVPSLSKTYSDGRNEGYAGKKGYPPAYLGAVMLSIEMRVLHQKHDSGETPYQKRII